MGQKYFLENFDNFSIFSSAKEKQFKTTTFSGMVSLLVLCLSLFGYNVHAQNFTDNTPGTRTFSIPCGVTSITVEAWGGGGAGGGTTVNNAKGGGAGAGGTYASSTLTVSPGQIISYTVGAGGLGADSAGATGQASWFSTTGTLYAQGGDGGYAPNGGTVTGGLGSIATSIGTTRLPGVNGGSGTATLGAAGGAGGNSGGAGGGTRGTGGGNGRSGNTPGGGGGGAFVDDNGDRRGGHGGDGQIRITYTSTFQNYCVPSFTDGVRPTTNVTFAGINNTTTATLFEPQHEEFCDVSNVIQGSATNAISVKGNTNGNNTYHFRVYIDWDQNGIYGNNTNESYYLGTIVNSTGTDAITLIGNIAVPVTATLGNTRMRIMKRINNDPTNPCGVYTWGQSEEYTVNVNPPPAPTISSFTPGSGCAGNTITITGTNLTGATAVTIGGTAASISTNTATQLTAVVGSGTTGAVVVTTIGGTATGASNFTVNPTPAAITGGATTVCVGSTTAAFTNTTAGGIWSVTAGTGSATITAGGVLTGVMAGNVTINYTLGTCSVSTALTVTAGSSITTTPSPTNGATGICYSGVALEFISWNAVAGATSYDVYFGAGSLPGVVTATVTTNTYVLGTLLPNTVYDWKIVPRNDCGATTGTPTIWSFTTGSVACYCTSSGTSGATSPDGIKRVLFNTIDNTPAGTASNIAYSDYTTINTTVTKGLSYPINVYVNTGGNFTNYQTAWIDWNGDGDFTDSGEYFNLGTANNVINGISNLCPLTITIPFGATSGSVRMRIQSSYAGIVNSCATGFYGEVEDYTLNIISNPTICTTPTTQPTSLALTPGGTSIAGSFTAATPVPTNYLVILSATNLAPVLTNVTNYTIGGSAGPGYTVVDTDTNTTFTAGGLNNSTPYYIFVYSYNGICTGGPLYNMVSPLSGNATTTSAIPSYCTASVSTNTQAGANYISTVSFVGTLNDTSNTSTYSTSPRGYQNFTTLTPLANQAQGEGVNVFVQTLFTSYIKAWVDWNKDGLFNDTTEIVYNTNGIGTASTTFGFIIPSGQPLGNYRIRIRTNGYDSSFSNPNSTNNFTSCNNINYAGETEDYLFTVVASCLNVITSVTDGITCGPGTVTLNATGSAGVTGYKWYTTATGGTAIAGATSATYITPVLSTTTTYYVTALNGCESLVRTAVVANINPIPTLSFTPTNPIICGENAVISITASGDTEQVVLIDEKFEGGSLGVFTNSNNVSNPTVDVKTAWRNRTSTFIPTEEVWFPAIASNFGSNHFVMATSDIGMCGSSCYYTIDNLLVSPTINTNTFLDLTLTFKAYFSRYNPDTTNPNNEYFALEINEGSGWTAPAANKYTSEIGIGTQFSTISINMSAYVNKPNLKFRLRYYSNTWADGVAVDDIKLFGTRPLNTAFDWSSATPVVAYTNAACTIPYVPGTPVVTVHLKPTLAQLELDTYNFTAIATLSNGCYASQVITVTNNTKIWLGLSSNWADPNNWKPAGVSTSANCVIIPNYTLITGTGTHGYAKNLTVKSTGVLDIESDSNLTVKEWVNVNTGGIFNMKNNASLIQIDNAPNIGIIKMERKTQPMYRYDYTYWGSPLTQASGFTVGNLSPGSSLRYSWTPSVGGLSGNWAGVAASTVMTAAKGYIVRAPDSFSTNPAIKVPYTATFIGTPNNGDLSIPITFGSMGPSATNDKWNLISNPYPSAIDAGAFLSEVTNQTLLDGTIYFWTHNSPPSNITPDPFYGDFAINYTANDYASWNRMGGTGTQALSFGPSPTSYIAAGSAFFVKSLGVSGNATFTNSMRVSDNNNQFYRTANPMTQASPSDNFEKHRIWLNLTNNSGAFNQILVGYAEGATLGMDRDFDGTRFGGNGVTLYSILPEANLGIQGRPLPFDVTDKVILGFNAAAAGTFSVRIDHVDGLFNTQNIYLEDKLLQVIHNLKLAPYVFTTAAGNFNNRFVLRYTESTLGTDTFDVANTVKVTVNEKVTVHAANLLIKEITVFDLLGRKIDTYKNISATQFTLNHLYKTNNVLILKITLENDAVVTEKIIF